MDGGGLAVQRALMEWLGLQERKHHGRLSIIIASGATLYVINIVPLFCVC